MTVFGHAFWVDAGERAVKTAAQAALLVLGQDVVGFDVFSADWGSVAGFAAGGAVLSLLTSIISSGRPSTVSPASLVKGDS